MIRLNQPLLPSLETFANSLNEIWQTGWLTNNGAQSIALENELKKHLQAENLSLFCNGTIALLLGIKSLKLKGEVITTPFTFPATVHCLEWAGLTPVFVDIDRETLTLDPERVRAAITPNTCAILGVHVFGIPCHVYELKEIADEHDLKVIYDAAHAFGTQINGMPITDFGDMSMLSFHATKLFHTAEGGALIYKDPTLRQQLHLLHNFGIQDENTVLLAGINGKINEIQAALGRNILPLVEQERSARDRVIKRYSARFEQCDKIRVMTPPSHIRNSCQYMPILINSSDKLARDHIYKNLKNEEIIVRRYFYPLCSDYPCYKNITSSSPINLPIAYEVVNKVLCLPLYSALTDDEVDLICEKIIKHIP